MNKISIKQRLKNALTGYKKAFVNAPVELILCALAATLALFRLHGDDFVKAVQENLQRGMMVLVLAIPLSMFTERLIFSLKKSKSINTFIRLCGVALIILYYFVLIPDFKMQSLTRFFCILIFITVVYVLTAKIRQKNIHQYVLYLLKRLFFTAVYALVIWGGVSFTFYAFEMLMDINLWDEVYMDILLVTVGFIIPAYFFSAVPKGQKNIRDYDLSGFLITLLSYILVPIIFAYTVVIYIYFVKLLVTFNWPDGMLGHLVFWYALAGIAVMFFLRSIYKDKKITLVFYKIFPVVILIPLVMMFVSLGIRINAYGFTEPRYGVFILGFWVFVSMILFALKVKITSINKVILTLLAVTLVISSLGPVSAYAISKRSQNMRFARIVEEYDIFANINRFDPNDMTQTHKKEAKEILRYFERNHSLDDIKALPVNYDKKMLNKLFDYRVYPEPVKRIGIFLTVTENFTLDVKGYDYIFGMHNPRLNTILSEDAEYKISVEDNTKLVILKGDNFVYSKDISEFVNEAFKFAKKTDDSHTYKVPNDKMIFYDENELFKLKFFVLNAYCEQMEEDLNVSNVKFYTAIKLK